MHHSFRFVLLSLHSALFALALFALGLSSTLQAEQITQGEELAYNLTLPWEVAQGPDFGIYAVFPLDTDYQLHFDPYYPLPLEYRGFVIYGLQLAALDDNDHLKENGILRGFTFSEDGYVGTHYEFFSVADDFGDTAVMRINITITDTAPVAHPLGILLTTAQRNYTTDIQAGSSDADGDPTFSYDYNLPAPSQPNIANLTFDNSQVNIINIDPVAVGTTVYTLPYTDTQLTTYGTFTTQVIDPTLTGTVAIDSADGVETPFTGSLDGTGGIDKTGAGILTFLAPSTYTGATTVSAGTLRVGASNVLSDASAVILDAGTTLDLLTANTSDTIGSLAGAGQVLLGSASTLTVGYDNTSTTFSGVISGDGNLTKIGTGNFTLNTTNTYTGTTTINAGQLTLDYSGLGSNAANLLSGSPLAFGTGTSSTATLLLKNAVGGGATTQTFESISTGGGTDYILADPAAGTTISLSTSTLTLGGTIIVGVTNPAQENQFTFNVASTPSFDSSGSVPVSLLYTLDGGVDPANLFFTQINGGVVSRHVADLNPTGNYTGAANTAQIRLTTTGAAQSWTNSGDISASSGLLFVGADDYNINGGTIGGQLTSGNLMIATFGTGKLTLNSTLIDGSISNQLTKSGPGTLALTAANTYTGGTLVTGGLIRFSSLANFGTGLITLTGGGLQWATGNTADVSARLSPLGQAGGTFDTNGNNVTFASALSGTGALTKTGAGTLILGMDNTYSSGTTITGGTLQIGNGGTTGSVTGDILDNAALVFNRSDDVTFTGLLSGTGSLTQSGAGTLILTRANTYTGGTTISAGTLQINDGGSIPGDVIDNAALVFNHSDDVTFAGTISGTGTLTHTGISTLTLTGNNTITGGSTITGGTLQIGDGGTSGTLTGDVTNTGALRFNRSDVVTFSGNSAGTGTLTQAGAGTLKLTGNNTHTGGTTIASGTLQIGDGGTTGTLTGNITNNALLVVDRSDAVTLAGDIFGSGSLTQSGAGTLTLTGNNSYAGGTSITNGLINFATLANLSTGPVTLNGGGLQWATGSTVDVSGLLAPLGSAGGIFDTNGNAVTLASALSGSGALTKIGAGTLTLGTANTYTGGTTVSGGTLAVSSGSNLGTGPVHVTGSGQLSGGNSILILNTSVSIDSPSAALTSTNALEFGNAATGSLAISGGGTVNASTYVGIGLATATASASVTGAGSSLTTGDLYIGATGGTGSLAIGDGGTVTANTVYFGYVGGSGTLDLNAGGTLATGGISSPGTAHFNLSGGTVKVTGSGLTTSVAATLSNASTINTNGLSALFSGNLSGNGSLNKTGAGALTLTGNNSYNGGTSVTAGTLVKASDHAAGTGAIVVSGGVFLINNGVNATDNAVTLSGGEYDRTLSASANLANAVNASSSFADGNPDTIASILQGTLTTGATLQTSFANMSSALNDTSRISDVYSFHGTGTDTFVLQLSMTSVNAESMLVWLDTSTNTWVNAVFGNTGTNDILFVNGAYDGDLVLGHYGVDVSTGSVWAVLDHNSDFAAVPEPATVALIALGFGLIILRKRKA